VSDGTSGITADVLDKEQIDLLLSLDDGQGAVLEEIIAEFLITSHGVRAQLLEGLNDGDTVGLQRDAHTLKGASANVGATRLVEVCARIEVAASGSPEDERVELTQEFQNAYTDALDALRALRPVE
jgi:HPt (histidine-containing phosphotransfer) domain-containing protein